MNTHNIAVCVCGEIREKVPYVMKLIYLYYGGGRVVRRCCVSYITRASN